MNKNLFNKLTSLIILLFVFAHVKAQTIHLKYGILNFEVIDSAFVSNSKYDKLDKNTLKDEYSLELFIARDKIAIVKNVGVNELTIISNGETLEKYLVTDKDNYYHIDTLDENALKLEYGVDMSEVSSIMMRQVYPLDKEMKDTIILGLICEKQTLGWTPTIVDRNEITYICNSLVSHLDGLLNVDRTRPLEFSPAIDFFERGVKVYSEIVTNGYKYSYGIIEMDEGLNSENIFKKDHSKFIRKRFVPN